MLNKRQQQIIKILEQSGNWITGKELSAVAEVSVRTIRSDVAAINEFYGSSKIESDKRRGYQSSQDLVHVPPPQNTDRIPKNSEERCSYILQALMNKKELNLISLQGQLYTSDYSIENDIRKIKRLLESWPDLVLIRKANHLRLAGSEKSKRNLYRKMLTEEIEGNFLNLNNLASLYTNFDLLDVKKILDKVFTEFSYRVREVAVPMLMLHIGVSIERIRDKNFMQTDKHYEDMEDKLEYKIAKRIYEEVGKKLSIPVIQDEIVLLALYLSERNGTQTTENREYNCLVECIMESLYQTFGIDFREDPELRKGLGSHIRYMLERIPQTGGISNVCLQDFKGRYPLVFEMGCHVARLIEDSMNFMINETEIGFIALHLGCAYERLNLGEKYRVVIICPYNEGLLSLCISKINLFFKEKMELIGCLTIFEKSEVISLNPDLLITTFPLKHDLDIPTIQISLLMNRQDESTILQVLNSLDCESFQERYMPRIISMFRPEFFWSRLELTTPEDIIGFLCDHLYTAGYLPDSFKESVLIREKFSATSFSYSFAIPHSLNIPSLKSVFPVVLLKKPVQWGVYEVKMVVLLAIAEEDRDLMRIFFDWLGNLAGDAKKLLALMEAVDRDSFVTILKNPQ